MNNNTAENCLLISENDVLGLLLPYCQSLTIIIMNNAACEYVYCLYWDVDEHLIDCFSVERAYS